MQGDERVVLSPIADDDIDRVAEFLQATMTSGVAASAWASAMRPSWPYPQPNHGFMLVQADRVVGAYLALYSAREIDGKSELFCNLAAWSVLEEHRSQSVRLLRALLKQKQYHLTDFSPSGSVIALNERLGFSYLDNRTTLVPCLPVAARRSTRVIVDAEKIERVLTGDVLQIHLDHRNSPVHQLVLKQGDRTCLVVFRRERFKRLRSFVTILYVSEPALFCEGLASLGGYLFRRKRVIGMFVEDRLAGGVRPRRSLRVTPPRHRMYKANGIDPEQIDYLYSELTSVAW